MRRSRNRLPGKPQPTVYTCALLLVLLVRPVAAHGVVCYPRQRAAADGYGAQMCGGETSTPKCPATDFCPHCLSGGRPETISRNLPPSGWHPYDPIRDFDRTATRAGLCGDVKGNNDHMVGGKFMCSRRTPIVTTWSEGQDVDLEVAVHKNHNGFFQFYLCDLDACDRDDIDGRCFKNGHCHLLQRVPSSTCEKGGEDMHFKCGRVDRRHTDRWYVPCDGGRDVRLGGRNGLMRYRLPRGVFCEHCVLQWYWQTGNRCNGPDFASYFKRNDYPFGRSCEGDGGALGGYQRGKQECAPGVVPEEFWSCADVRIEPRGERSGRPGRLPEEVEAEDEQDVTSDERNDPDEMDEMPQDSDESDLPDRLDEVPEEDEGDRRVTSRRRRRRRTRRCCRRRCRRGSRRRRRQCCRRKCRSRGGRRRIGGRSTRRGNRGRE